MEEYFKNVEVKEVKEEERIYCDICDWDADFSIINYNKSANRDTHYCKTCARNLARKLIEGANLYDIHGLQLLV